LIDGASQLSTSLSLIEGERLASAVYFVESPYGETKCSKRQFSALAPSEKNVLMEILA
jgi:hypothetical protein